MAHIAGKAVSLDGVSDAAARQWKGLQRRFVRGRGLVEDLVKHGAEWGNLVAVVARANMNDGPGELQRVVLEMHEKLGVRKREFALRRNDNWKAWVRQQIRCGGGALHRYAKRQIEPIEAVTETPEGPSGLPQDLVNANLRDWLAVWVKDGGCATAPWRTEELREEDFLPKPTVHDLRRGANGFKENTGVGLDFVPPRLYGWLSDQLLENIATLMYLAERSGGWPQALAVLLMHLIPKATGGHRPIALLASILRLWENDTCAGGSAVEGRA